MSILRRPRRHAASPGQALVEFSLALIVFIMLLLAVFDFGRAIFMYNGVSQAAREIARATSVHPWSPISTGFLGMHQETTDAFAAQKALVPNLSFDNTGNATDDVSCVDKNGSAIAEADCKPGVHYVKVTVRAQWNAITPLLSFLGTYNLESSSSIRLPE